ncbi:hypothetical protein Ddye_031914 [Dipteronia dyeriana]|uniref:Uncharacterized protein n=1 Tax=Dipteronia dyeriana TaxID=168575 RepID=A0AAD9TJW1_9ROSI|nr:hypothetical protein Ddye_031914 [Dipteronia dyeriana]
MELVDVDVDVDDKAEWSTRNDVIFIRIMHEHVKNGRGDRMFREYENEDMLIEGEGEAEAEGRPITNIDLSPSNVALMSNVRDEIAKKNVERLLTQ